MCACIYALPAVVECFIIYVLSFLSCASAFLARTLLHHLLSKKGFSPGKKAARLIF